MTLYHTVLCLVTQSCPTPCDPRDYSPPGSSVHGDSPGKNTRVGCPAVLQGIFLTQGSNRHLLRRLHWQMGSLPMDSLPQAPPGKPSDSLRSADFGGCFNRIRQLLRWGEWERLKYDPKHFELVDQKKSWAAWTGGLHRKVAFRKKIMSTGLQVAFGC